MRPARPLLACLSLVVTMAAATSAHAEPDGPRKVAFSAGRSPEAPRAPRTEDAFIVESHVHGSGEDDTGQCAALCGVSSADVMVLMPTSERIGMVSRLWGNTLQDAESSITYGLAGAGVRVRVLPAMWIDAGVGVAHASIDRDDGVDVVALASVAPAAIAAAGATLGEIGGFELDAQARGGTSLYEVGLPVREALLLLRARW